MEYKISVTLNTDANHTFESAETVIGRAGEGSATRMEITIPTELEGCSVYLDFEKPNGEKLRTPELEIENSKAVYYVAQYLLTDYGEIKVQAVCITEDSKIWKSSKKTYHILKSINAIDDIPNKEDFMTEAQELLDELREEGKYILATEISTSEEMDAIISGASAEDVGTLYRYMGETTEQYTNGEVYRIVEV